MRYIMMGTVLLVATSATARAQSETDLDAVVREFCATGASPHPVCHGDPTDTPAYRWLLLADACDHDRSPGYCARFADIRARTEPCVVAYSHRLGRWRPRHLLETREKWAYDTDVNGVPTIVVSRSDQCTPIIEHTTPLVYRVQPGDVTVKDTDVVSGLKDLAALLGATLQATAPVLKGLTISPRNSVDDTMADLRRQKAIPTAFEELAATTWTVAQSLLQVGDLKAEVIVALNAAEVFDTGALTPVNWRRARLDAASWHTEFERLRAARGRAIESLQGQPPDDKQRPILDQAQKVLDRQDESAKVVASLTMTRARWDRFVLGDRMMTWMVAPLRAQPIGWTRDQIHALKITVDTPFAGDVATMLPKVDTSVRLTSPRASMFGIDAGLVVTPLEQVTYKAVAGPGGVKRITATERDSRTGQLALFIDWRLVQLWRPAASAWRVRPALQGGVAVDTRTPGFFLGASTGLTKWMRLSAGRTWQSVRVLDGQQENDPVENNDAIRLRDAFEARWYVSASFAIDEVPLFNAK